MLSLILGILFTLGSVFWWVTTLMSDPGNSQECKDVANMGLKIGLPIAALFFVAWWFKW